MIYILHGEEPLAVQKNGHRPQHYIGWSATTSTLWRRVRHHRMGTARCKYTEAMHKKGIDLVVARVFVDGDRTHESMIKNKIKNGRELCPICNPGRAYAPYGLHIATEDFVKEIDSKSRS